MTSNYFFGRLLSGIAIVPVKKTTERRVRTKFVIEVDELASDELSLLSSIVSNDGYLRWALPDEINSQGSNIGEVLEDKPDLTVDVENIKLVGPGKNESSTAIEIHLNFSFEHLNMEQLNGLYLGVTQGLYFRIVPQTVQMDLLSNLDASKRSTVIPKDIFFAGMAEEQSEIKPDDAVAQLEQKLKERRAVNASPSLDVFDSMVEERP